ncbi:MAG: FGGY-family carbohydrate kinase [Chitinophagaceae bacterium]
MIAVIAVFDIGKTNKKFFLFNEQYEIIFESTQQFNETVDEDGDACDNVQLLSSWVVNTLAETIAAAKFDIKAVNFSTYGASFVHINKEGEPITPLYNYLKPFPENLKQSFYQQYGTEASMALETASPTLGNLNSGMQLYWLQQIKPAVFNQVAYSLHLPQYISYLITKKAYSDITSIGCHTQLWNFQQQLYHSWVNKTKIIEKLAELFPSDATITAVFNHKQLEVGIGLHDSSAALIPYLASFNEPFILISTGTWCISLNPFNKDPLTAEELQEDCLCYMAYKGNPVKASRLFSGYEHEQQTKRLAQHFGTASDYYKQVNYNEHIITNYEGLENYADDISTFESNNLTQYATYEEAYHHFIFHLIVQQKKSTSLVLGSKSVSRLFVDGGFGKNKVFMHMLANVFPTIQVYAASVAQATALGAAIAIHASWNKQALPNNLIQLKQFNTTNINVGT